MKDFTIIILLAIIVLQLASVQNEMELAKTERGCWAMIVETGHKTPACTKFLREELKK